MTKSNVTVVFVHYIPHFLNSYDSFTWKTIRNLNNYSLITKLMSQWVENWFIHCLWTELNEWLKRFELVEGFIYESDGTTFLMTSYECATFHLFFHPPPKKKKKKQSYGFRRLGNSAQIHMNHFHSTFFIGDFRAW